MNTSLHAEPPSHAVADDYGRRIAGRLSHGLDELPYDISERLRASRMQALARRKKPVALPVVRPVVAPIVLPSGRGAVMGGGPDQEGARWWQRFASVVPLMALVLGLVFVQTMQEQSTIDEVAEVDAALLTDDLPPSAYADPGFVQFLKTSLPER